MEIISFNALADIIRKILVHLELWEKFTQRRPPPLLPQVRYEYEDARQRYEPDDDSRSLSLTWPGYEEPQMDMNSL